MMMAVLRLITTTFAILVSVTLPTAYGAEASHQFMVVDGIRLFYREAGDSSKPTIVLLHGFPSSSYEFHELIPLLGDRFHVLAPDYPGMGYSDAPSAEMLTPTFDNLATVTQHFLRQLGVTHFILYMHDFGGPVGMRIVERQPDLIDGLVFQNTTISLDGYDPARLSVFQRIGGPETPQKLAEAEQAASETRDIFLHKTGAQDFASISPDNWAVDAFAFGIPADREFMSRLLMNIEANITHYPAWSAVLRATQPKTLIVWGQNDPVFKVAAADAIKRDNPTADVHLFNGGHFVLDEFSPDIARMIIQTFGE